MVIFVVGGGDGGGWFFITLLCHSFPYAYIPRESERARESERVSEFAFTRDIARRQRMMMTLALWHNDDNPYTYTHSMRLKRNNNTRI